MTERAEIDRTRFLHEGLDRLAAVIQPSNEAPCFIWHDCKSYEYTAAEIRAWPKTKAELVAAARLEPHHNVAWCPSGFGAPYTFKSTPSDRSQRSLCAADSIARGLCIYKEMLSDSPALSTGHPAPGSESLRLNEAQREAVEPKVDPYAEHRRKLSLRIDSEDPEMDVGLATLEKRGSFAKAARARNIAALAAELRKPVEPRFPPEGRSDRVTGYRRW